MKPICFCKHIKIIDYRLPPAGRVICDEWKLKHSSYRCEILHTQTSRTRALEIYCRLRSFKTPTSLLAHTWLRINQSGISLLVWTTLKPFHSQEWSISNFPCSLTRNITLPSMKNLAFHRLLRWKMIILLILATSLIFSFRGWENARFELGSERVNTYRGAHADGSSPRAVIHAALEFNIHSSSLTKRECQCDNDNVVGRLYSGRSTL